MNKEIVELGSEPEKIEYSQTAILNINRLLKAFKQRMGCETKSKTDSGQIVTTNIFSVDEMVTFLCLSLCRFNSFPPFSNINFDDTEYVEKFADILIQGAAIVALKRQSLIEKGNEIAFTDEDGVDFTPPEVSEVMIEQYETEDELYMQNIQGIKYALSADLDRTSTITKADAIDFDEEVKKMKIEMSNEPYNDFIAFHGNKEVGIAQDNITKHEDLQKAFEFAFDINL